MAALKQHPKIGLFFRKLKGTLWEAPIIRNRMIRVYTGVPLLLQNYYVTFANKELVAVALVIQVSLTKPTRSSNNNCIARSLSSGGTILGVLLFRRVILYFGPPPFWETNYQICRPRELQLRLIGAGTQLVGFLLVWALPADIFGKNSGESNGKEHGKCIGGYRGYSLNS